MGSAKIEILTSFVGRWCGNGQRFPTEEEAKAAAAEIYDRWVMVKATRVRMTAEPATHHWVPGHGAVPLSSARMN